MGYTLFAVDHYCIIYIMFHLRNPTYIVCDCRLRKQQVEEDLMQHKQQVEELTKQKNRLQRKIDKLKKRNKELKAKLKEATTQAAPPPQPSPSVMLVPLPAALNTLAGLYPAGFEGNVRDGHGSHGCS